MASTGLAAIAMFELLLAAGVPWGRAAWGGQEDALSPGRRVASVVAACVWGGAALLVLARAGIWPTPRPSRWLRWSAWLLVGLLLLGVLLNLASSSPWERFGWAPFAGVMATLCFKVARMAPVRRPNEA